MLTDNIILECFFNLLTDSILLYYKNMFNRIGLMGYKKIILTSAVLYINEKNGSVFLSMLVLFFLRFNTYVSYFEFIILIICR